MKYSKKKKAVIYDTKNWGRFGIKTTFSGVTI